MGGFRNTLAITGDTAIIRNNKADIIIDAADASLFEKFNFYVHARGDMTTVTARCRQTDRQTKLARLVMDAPDDAVVDHIDGNPLDNRRSNLRVVSQRENRHNSVKPSHGTTSRFKGVCNATGRNRFRATIYHLGRTHNLGSFANEVEAARAYDAAARRMFGDTAALNFPLHGEQSAHRPNCGNYALANRATLERARDAINAQLAKLRPAVRA